MTLYEIDESIRALLESMVDPETGEVRDISGEIAALQMEKDAKVENVACWIKNMTSDIKALREEEKALADRRHALENKKERVYEWLARVMNGDKLMTARVAIGWRKSVSVDVDLAELLKDPDAERYLVYEEPKPDKNAIKDVLKAGGTIAGCTLNEHMNMSIK